MTEQNRQNTGSNSSSGDNKNEHSFYALAPQPLMIKDEAKEAEERAIAEAARKAEEEINKTLVDSVPILVRRSSIDAEVEALKKGPTQHQIRSTNRFDMRVAASRLQEQAARRPSVAQKNAPVVNQSTPAVTPDTATPEELVASNVASSPVRPRKPIISEVNGPLPEAKPLERPLMSSGPGGPRALVTPTKPRTFNSITVKKLAVHAAPSSLRIAAPTRSTVLTRLNPMVTRQSPMEGREAMLRNNPQPRATRPIVGKRTASGAIVATAPSAGTAVRHPAVVAGKPAPPSAAKAAPVAKRPAVVAGKPAPPSAAKAAPVVKRPAVVAGKPVPRENKAAAGSVVAGKPVTRSNNAPVVAGRPAATPPTSAPKPAAEDKKDSAAAVGAAKPSAKVRNAGHFLKRREAASTLRKRSFAESEPDLSKLPWTEGMLKLAAVPLLSDFFQVDAVMFETLSTYVQLELHTVKDYFSNCYSSESFALELSLLSEQIPVLREAFAKLPTEKVESGEESEKSASKDGDKADAAENSGENEEDKEVKDKDSSEDADIEDNKKSAEDEDGESKKDTEDKADAEKAVSEDSQPKTKLIISPQPLAINSECCRQFIKAYYPGLKNNIGDLLVDFYVLGSNENAEGTIYQGEPKPSIDESEASNEPQAEEKQDNSPKEVEETKPDEAAEDNKPESAAGDALDSLGLLDGIDLGVALDGGEIQLNDIKLDDLSFDDLLGGM
ncbi:MAG: hypothetical protein Q4F00_00930 [bacterium]|nr:hypothetical protein [bacterium]